MDVKPTLSKTEFHQYVRNFLIAQQTNKHIIVLEDATNVEPYYVSISKFDKTIKEKNLQSKFSKTHRRFLEYKNQKGETIRCTFDLECWSNVDETKSLFAEVFAGKRQFIVMRCSFEKLDSKVSVRE